MYEELKIQPASQPATDQWCRKQLLHQLRHSHSQKRLFFLNEKSFYLRQITLWLNIYSRSKYHRDRLRDHSEAEDIIFA